MAGDICCLCFEKSIQMKRNFQESVQNDNIMDFVEHFCQFIFQDNAIVLGDICMKCWLTIHQFSQFCEKVRGIHQNLVDETNETGLGKHELQTEVLEDEIDDPIGLERLEGYEYDKSLPSLAIDVNLVDDVAPRIRRTELKSKVDARLNKQLEFEAQIIDLDEVDFERFARFIPMECTPCKYQFGSFEDCNDHHLSVHNRPAVWNCCNLLLETPYDALDHMKYHESIEIFKCAACYKCFLTSNKLKYHIRRTHIPLKEGQFECTVCDKKFKNLRFLLNHQKCHIQIICTHCNKLISASNYEQHIRSVHATGQIGRKRKSNNKNEETPKIMRVADEPTPTSTSIKPSNVPVRRDIVSRSFAVSNEPNENGMLNPTNRLEMNGNKTIYKSISMSFY